MDNFADELRRQFHNRLAYVGQFVSYLYEQFPPVQERARLALELYRQYCDAARSALDDDWLHLNDSVERVDLLRLHLRDLNDRASELEDWFAGAATTIVPPSLVDAVERELNELLKVPRQVILSIGQADNCETLVSELQDMVFGALGPHRPKLDPSLASVRFALLRLPRLESGQPSWRPLVLGHEVAHLALLERPTVDDFDIERRLDPKQVASLEVPDHLVNLGSNPVLAFKTAGEQWVEELICDAYAVHRFGPAAVAALGGFLESVGSFDEVGDHPPGWLRCRLLVYWLGSPYSRSLENVMEPWREMASLPEPSLDPWASYLSSVLWDARDEFLPLLADWPAVYDIRSRGDAVEWLASEFKNGVARADCLGAPLGGGQLLDADIINAAWVGRHAGGNVPIDELADKSLESVDFVRRWEEHAGTVSPIKSFEGSEDSAAGAVLSEPAISARLLSTEPAKRLVITPAGLSLPVGASIDVRLGKHFIVFERSSTPAFSAALGGARRMQSAVEKSWGDYFVLHPGELVLASTLEYLVLPGDLAATVITRSSYGRLGLLSATAVMVHPWYKGCLTLELINLGRVPLQLQPGERIAQLAFQHVDPACEEPSEAEKYRCNTKPEFSKVSLDAETTILRAISGRRVKP